MLRRASCARPARPVPARARAVAPRRHYSDSKASAAPPPPPAGPEVLFQTISNGSTHAQVVTLNRPKALNALNLNMIRLMYPNYRVRHSISRRRDTAPCAFSLSRAV